MTKSALIQEIKNKKSFLCVGLDPDLQKIPQSFLALDQPILAFNKAIIDATKEYAVAYKLNIAFYEAMGKEGWEILEATRAYIPNNCLTIADAKRGDIGNTAAMYAKTFFETYPFDSVTVAPYMGKDSIAPFLNFEGKWTILLGLTSNEGSQDFQLLNTDGQKLYEKVLSISSEWGSTENLMYVIGATQGELLTSIRNIIPHHFLLIPGVGAQGGTVKEVAKATLNDDYGILINVSRGISYPSGAGTFEENVAAAAQSYHAQMQEFFN